MHTSEVEDPLYYLTT
jgi:hypothetical protein